MIEAEGKYLRYIREIGSRAARVTVQIDLEAPAPGIETKCSGYGWIAQGYLEEASAMGYDGWKAGAIAGAKWALQRCAVQRCKVVITRIIGLLTDTNPTVVAAATAMAVWNGLNYCPTDEETQLLETLVRHSAYEDIARFEQQRNDRAEATLVAESGPRDSNRRCS